MNLFEFTLLTASLTAVLIGPTSADRPKGSGIPTNNYPPDLLASRIEGLLTGPAAGQVLPLNLADKPAVQAFYTRRSYSAAWCKDTGTGAKDRTELALVTQAGDYELMTMLHHVPQLQTLPDSLAGAAGTGGQMERLARSACCWPMAWYNLRCMCSGGSCARSRIRRRKKAGVRLSRRPGWPGRWPHRALQRPCCAASHHNASQRALAHWQRQPVHNTLAHNQRAQQMALTLEW